MGALSAWMPTSVRARLLLSFGVLFISAVVLAVVGWQGMRDTARSMETFRSRVLPEVALSLELSQRMAAIAAMAPYVAESTLPFQLQAEALAMQARMAAAEELAATLPANSSLATDLVPVLAEVRANVEELIDITRKDLFLQEDLSELRYQTDSLRAEVVNDRSGAGVQSLLRDIEAAIQARDVQALEPLKTRIDEQAGALLQDHRTPEAVSAFLRHGVLGADSVFSLRQRHFVLAERKSYLVVKARTQAERLGERVEAYVHGLRAQVDAEGLAVDRALHSGVVGIAIIGLACAVAALFGIAFVNRTVRSLGGITRGMSLLASGDVEQSMPASSRQDELGALARAFEVFRENAREIRRMSGDLREQSNLLETVFDSIRDGLSVFDRDGRLLTWNRQYASILQLPDDVLKRGMDLEMIQALLPGQVSDGAYTTSGLSQLNTQRQHEGYRFELTLPGGKVVEFRSNPMPGGGFVTLYSDLTERRSVELQLRQAQKMEVLGQLTSGVAHDFNNLLAAIIGNLHLLEDGGHLSARDQRFALRVRKAAERGVTLTARLLAFARRQTLVPQSVHVDSLIQDLADLIEYSVGGAVALDLSLNVRGARMWVDKGHLENAVLNLVINARDAMPTGGRLKLQTSLDGERRMIRIDVADTGRGMDDSVRERVFEPFFTTKADLGSGLGLSIVYGFVKQSGGDILLLSEVGKGTTFSLLLPLAHEQAVSEPVAPEAPPEEPVSAQSVLLVEDDTDVQLAVADLLGEMGHAVTVAGTAQEALALLSASMSMVLSDVDLGGAINGAQLARELAERHPKLPCILMSGLPYEVLSARFHLAEPALLLAKPFSVRQLNACMHRALAHAKA